MAACPNADRIFKVYESFITSLMYRKFKVPVPLFKGYGLSYVPRPLIKLTHYLSKPITPPKLPSGESPSDEMIDHFHRTIVDKMKHLMEK